MTGDRGIALSDDSRPGEDGANPAHLRITQTLLLLQLREQLLALFGERGGRSLRDSTRHAGEHQGRQNPTRYHGELLRVR